MERRSIRVQSENSPRGTPRAYAWSYGLPDGKCRFWTVLQTGPIRCRAGRYRGGTKTKVNRTLNSLQIWLASLLVSGIAVTLSFLYLDVPIALWFSGNLGNFHTLGTGLGSAVLLSAEAITTLTLVLVRLVRGHLSPLGKMLVLACLTSMCAYAVNDSALKLFFGVVSPAAFLAEGAHHHAVHFLGGDRTSGFPSGHMVLAGSFAGVLMKLHPSSTWPLSILVLFGAGMLIFGDWHFASDVIAGGFVGVSAGMLSGALWQAHSS